MKRKYSILFVILVIILILAGLLIMRKNSGSLEDYKGDDTRNINNREIKGNNDTDPSQQKTDTNLDAMKGGVENGPGGQNAANVADKEIQGRFSSEEDIGGGSAQVFRVTFDGNSFNPPSLRLSKGDIVWFENSASEALWVTNNNLVDFPQLDSGKDIKRGERFELMFQRTGKFDFSNKHDGTKGSLEVSP